MPKVAVALLLESATLAAVRVTTPADAGAVNMTEFPEVIGVVGENDPPPLEEKFTPALVVSLVSVTLIDIDCDVTRPPRRGETLTVMLDPPEDDVVADAMFE